MDPRHSPTVGAWGEAVSCGGFRFRGSVAVAVAVADLGERERGPYKRLLDAEEDVGGGDRPPVLHDYLAHKKPPTPSRTALGPYA